MVHGREDVAPIARELLMDMIGRLRDKSLVLMHPERDRIADEIERLQTALEYWRESRIPLKKRKETKATVTNAADEIDKLRALLREVLDDTPMYRIDRMTEEKIRAALKSELDTD
jgi:hypothetical protein